MLPIEYIARDSLKIHGYLTLPLGSSGKNLPLIVHPHGGPHGIRDEWLYNDRVQFLANRGYAVLRVPGARLVMVKIFTKNLTNNGAARCKMM